VGLSYELTITGADRLKIPARVVLGVFEATGLLSTIVATQPFVSVSPSHTSTEKEIFSSRSLAGT
jgi:hypothetical protein